MQIRVPGEGPPWPVPAPVPDPARLLEDATGAVRGQLHTWKAAGHVQFAEASLDELRGQHSISRDGLTAVLAVLEREGVIEAAGWPG